ncbi:hypothetical protein Golob_011481, partial [Gossypium lobatum]|nr:hypothetical protein [Gossypium lobatum]
MEMMNLKPSLARELNQDGFSSIHLALLNQQTEMVIDFLSVDKDLICVKGKGVSLQADLHVAAEKKKFKAFKAMLEWIQSTFEDNKYMRGKILNLQDKNGNTVLHLAASINHP